MKAIREKVFVWDEVLVGVRRGMRPDIFATWFPNVHFVAADSSRRTVVLRAGKVTYDWVTRYYRDLLAQSLSEAGFEDFTIEWDVEPEQPIEPSRDDLELSEADFVFSPMGAAGAGRPAHASTMFADIEPAEDFLNPKYTFEKFVVGSCNQFAHAAAKSTAEMPGVSYNPLFIYGGVGLGKTHLMHAIGHSIKQRSPHLRVAYITSERFMNELINAIRFNKTAAFRDKYRSIDCLLLDDVQFLAGKDRTQEEFFHTFNALHNGQKQIVISSDCQPRAIPTLSERLHSRFEWGLIADLEPPDLETKVAILKRRADMDGILLDDDIAMYVASKVRSNVRELEGSFVRLVAISSMKGVPITKALAQESMKSILSSERPTGLTIERIIKVVAAHFDLSAETLKSKNNSRAIAEPRQIAMFLCKKLTAHSFPEIGREFGGKHHTTVMHSVDKIANLDARDGNFHKEIAALIDNLSS